MRRIAVIDIGSNSIKCLVVLERNGGGLASVYENTLPVRISAGISADQPMLSVAAMEAGVEATAQLVSECSRVSGIEEILIVGTSAVREALNAEDFIQSLYTLTGILIRVLSGEEEAELIGRGVVEDPIVVGQYDQFTVADLGGGSLELIAISNGKPTAQASFPLGAVRLTERFLPDSKRGITPETQATIEEHVRKAIERSAFPLAAPIVGTGGLVTVWRSMEAQAHGVTLPELSPVLSQSSLHGWIYRLQQMNWSERLNVPGLPASRADIVIPGMIVIDQILQLAGASELTHSRFNLRYGVAAEWFARHPASTEA